MDSNPASSKLNILLYTGAGATPSPIQHTYSTLRAMLGGRYDILRVDAKTLTTEPWELSTALLVMPGGRDIPMTQTLGPKGARRVRLYVQAGGKYWGLCAGAYYAARAIEFEKEDPDLCVVGDRDLALFPGIAKGAVFPGFKYDTEDGARAVALVMVAEGAHELPPPPAGQVAAYFNGGCYFDLESMSPVGASVSQVQVLARYADPSPAFPTQPPGELPAMVRCKLGSGLAVLSGAHIEYSPALLAGHPNADLVRTLAASNEARVRILAWILRDCLGMQLAPPVVPWDPHVLNTDRPHTPIYALTCASASSTPSDLAAALRTTRPPNHSAFDSWTLTDACDAFSIHVTPTSTLPTTDPLSSTTGGGCGHKWPLLLLPLPSHQPQADTPFFSLTSYTDHLTVRRSSYRHVPWLVGTHILLSRVITSTQSILDKNPTFLGLLPAGTVLVGYHQTLGRGRGRNAWISPPGCLQFSFVVKLSLKPGGATRARPYVPPAMAVHVQYLMALAVAKAACLQAVGVRVKWPNDVYARNAATAQSQDQGQGQGGRSAMVKIGGILVTSSIADNEFSIVVGCGLNVDNPAPTTSVNKILETQGLPKVSLEQVLADVLVAFDLVWMEFVASAGMSEGLRQEYYKAWMHSGQRITVAADAVGVVGQQNQGDGGAGGEAACEREVRIIGIDDQGYLETVEVGASGQRIVVQPDGNGFDMLKGLIGKKR